MKEAWPVPNDSITNWKVWEPLGINSKMIWWCGEIIPTSATAGWDGLDFTSVFNLWRVWREMEVSCKRRLGERVWYEGVKVLRHSSSHCRPETNIWCICKRRLKNDFSRWTLARRRGDRENCGGGVVCHVVSCCTHGLACPRDLPQL